MKRVLVLAVAVCFCLSTSLVIADHMDLKGRFVTLCENKSKIAQIASKNEGLVVVRPLYSYCSTIDSKSVQVRGQGTNHDPTHRRTT